MERTFGPYRLEELLGRGGMGEVFRAVDTRKGRVVALKVLGAWLADDEDFRRRFRREAEAAARVNDPHVVPIHDYGEIDGRLFIDMRFVRGRDLAATLRAQGPLLPEHAVAVIGQVASALDAAHAERLVHRDVKPSNILLTNAERDVGSAFAYLADFGIVRSQDNVSMATSAVMGSLDYMAPERFAGEPGDHAVDVYALAGVLHETLNRRPTLLRHRAGRSHARPPVRAASGAIGDPPRFPRGPRRGGREGHVQGSADPLPQRGRHGRRRAGRLAQAR